MILTIRNFGPVERAEIDLNKLTVFVGPSNSGKSYLSVLIYTLHTTAASTRDRIWMGPFRRIQHVAWPYAFMRPRPDLAPTVVEDVMSLFVGDKRQPKVSHDTLPQSVQDEVAHRLEAIFKLLAHEWRREIERCFAATMKELIRQGAKPHHATVSICSSRTGSKATVEFGSRKSRLTKFVPDFTGVDYDFAKLGIPSPALLMASGSRAPDRVRVADDIVATLAAAASEAVFPELTRRAAYLPSARSGILQSHRVLAGLVVRRAARFGMEKISIPALSGVITDFIDTLLNLDTTSKNATGPLAREIETRLLQGNVRMTHGDYPEIYYKSGGVEVPVIRASSMVSEQAPIVLFLRHLVATSEQMIIEEPESHLHPAHQRKVAEIAAILVKNGINLIVTTHSDFFVNELSNLIKASSLTPEALKRVGIDESVVLGAADVAAYFFDASPGMATAVHRLVVSSDEGIRHEDAWKVAMAQFDRSSAIADELERGANERSEQN